MSNTDKILVSWQANAGNWISTIEGNEIESRVLVTNAAIVDTILSYKPRKIIDIGCGEGWLTRKLRSSGIDAYGIDAIEALIKNAIEKGGEHYSVCSYHDVVNGKHSGISETDTVVFNFALLDKDVTEQLLLYLSSALKKGSVVFIQTLHPINIAADHAYESGWKDGSWNGLKRAFTDPYKWYFRTFGDWINLFATSRLTLKELKEPLHPVTRRPASVIFVLAVD